MKTDIHFWSYLVQIFLELNIFQAKFVEKIEKPFMIIYVSFENRTVYEIMWKSIVERDRPGS